MSTGKCKATLQGHTGRLHCVAISPDGATIVSGSVDFTLRWVCSSPTMLWDAASVSRFGGVVYVTNQFSNELGVAVYPRPCMNVIRYP